MISKLVSKKKGFPKIDGFIGKFVPVTPSFLGSFLFNDAIVFANSSLRYGIRILQGDPSCGGGSFGSALVLAVSIKESLVFEGFLWQAERLENWINKARANKGFLTGKYHPELPLRSLKAIDSARVAEGQSKGVSK